MKRFLSFLLSISLMCTFAFVVPTVEAATTPATVNVRQATNRLNQLISLMGANPDGLYFTCNRQPCVQGSHSNKCNNCEVSRVVSQQWLIDLIGMGGIDASLFPAQYNYDGAKWSNVGWQCFGFANFAHWYIFAQRNTDNIVSTLVGTGNMSYSFMTRCRPGDVIRTNGHSMVFISCDANGFNVLDCNIKSGNITGACCVRVRRVGYTGERIGVTGVANYDRDNYGNQITITFNANGGKFQNGSATSEKKYYEEDYFGVVDTPEKSGCRFSGYYTEPNGGVVVDQTTAVGSSKTLYAHYTPILDIRPEKTMEYNGHRYLLYNDCFGYDVANDLATRLGGHLVSITSQEEQNAVAQLIDSASNKNVCYWIALADYEVKNEFKWNTGETGDYRNWNENEPNKTLGLEHYAAILTSNKRWNDVMNQFYSSGFILEIDHNISGTPIAETTFGGHKYMMFDDGMGYDDASKKAAELGGHLVTINSAEEQEMLNNLIKNNGVRNSYWIGMTDSHKNGSFTWETNEPLQYTNWNKDEPNNDSGFENRAELGRGSEKWNDNLGITFGNGYIVEIETVETNTYDVQFDANGGSGAPGKQSTNQGSLVISNSVPKRDYFKFICWNTKQDGSGNNIQPNTTLPITQSISLYAQWKPRYGDVDNSGIVNSADALNTLQNSVKLLSFDEDQTFIGNVSGDTIITSNDALLILQYAVEKIDTFPVE